MQVEEFGKAILSVILRYPRGQDDIARRICYELDNDKFNPKFPNGAIYRVVQKIIMTGGTPNIPTVCRELGGGLDNVGGEEYLQSLIGYLSIMGVREAEGFETWVKVVDNAGRLRQLGLIIDRYAKAYEDFERLVMDVKDVNEFISNVLSEITKGTGSVRSSYVHVSQVAEEEKRRVEQERRGLVVDLVPTGWPSLERYFIPRPATYGVIAGLSSMGKTQFALQILLGAALHLYNNNLPGCVCINELEMNKWRLYRRLACCMAGINSDELASGRLPQSSYDKYNNMVDYIAQLPIYMDDNPDLTSSKLVWSAMASHLEHGPRVLGIADYIELFTDEQDSEELRVAKVVRTHRRVCWEVGSCEIAVSQFNNSVMLTSSKIGGKERARYSGAIAHGSDWFVEIWNPPQMRLAGIDFTLPDGYNGNCAYALIEKNKDHRVGREAFEWTPEFTRFRDMALPMGELYRTRPYVPEEEDF